MISFLWVIASLKGLNFVGLTFRRELNLLHFKSFTYIIVTEVPNNFHKSFGMANRRLRNICLDTRTTKTSTFLAILNYCTCTKVTELTLYIRQVITIFNVFNELRSFSFDCGEIRSDCEEGFDCGEKIFKF